MYSLRLRPKKLFLSIIIIIVIIIIIFFFLLEFPKQYVGNTYGGSPCLL